jgi:hypothetical protein
MNDALLPHDQTINIIIKSLNNILDDTYITNLYWSQHSKFLSVTTTNAIKAVPITGVTLKDINVLHSVELQALIHTNTTFIRSNGVQMPVILQ